MCGRRRPMSWRTCRVAAASREACEFAGWPPRRPVAGSAERPTTSNAPVLMSLRPKARVRVQTAGSPPASHADFRATYRSFLCGGVRTRGAGRLTAGAADATAEYQSEAGTARGRSAALLKSVLPPVPTSGRLAPWGRGGAGSRARPGA